MGKRSRYRDHLHPAHRARLEREDARSKLTTCVMPLCSQRSIYDDERGYLGICAGCGLDVAEYFDKLAETPALTERRLQRRLREHARMRQEDEDRRARAIAPGWVYYVQIADRIKIGYSTDLTTRLRSYPPEAKLLAVHPGTRTLEADMHRQFIGSRAAGREWYYPHDDLLAHIEQVVRQFGEPGRRGLSRLAVGVEPAVD